MSKECLSNRVKTGEFICDELTGVHVIAGEVFFVQGEDEGSARTARVFWVGIGMS
jgi:hypothetical protein